SLARRCTFPNFETGCSIKVKQMLGTFSARVFLGGRQLRRARRGKPVLVYHKIGSPPTGTPDPFLFITSEDFEKQMAALRDHGFSSATLAETSAADESLLRKVIITFDDGSCNAFQNSMEPLARHGFRAIQFLVAGFL